MTRRPSGPRSCLPLAAGVLSEGLETFSIANPNLSLTLSEFSVPARWSSSQRRVEPGIPRFNRMPIAGKETLIMMEETFIYERIRIETVQTQGSFTPNTESLIRS